MGEIVKIYKNGVAQDVDIDTIERPIIDTKFLKENAINNYLHKIESIGSQVTYGVPQIEKDSWSSKSVAAKEFLKGTATPDQLAQLDSERRWTGETREELVKTILESTESYSPISGHLAGMRRMIQKRLAGDDTNTPDGLSTAIKEIDLEIEEFTKMIGLSE